MDQVVSATEARIRFGELMQRATETQEPIVVERGGKPYVVVLSVAEYERLLAGQQERSRTALERLGCIREAVGQAYGVYQGDLVAEARAERERESAQAQGAGG